MFSGPDCYSSYPMLTVFLSFLSALCSCLQSRANLQVENLALRHQINLLRRRGRGQLHLKSGDRLLWVWLALRPTDRQARDGDSLAPQGLSPLLDLEKQTRSSW
jgi:hypothetical protein